MKNNILDRLFEDISVISKYFSEHTQCMHSFVLDCSFMVTILYESSFCGQSHYFLETNGAINFFQYHNKLVLAIRKFFQCTE